MKQKIFAIFITLLMVLSTFTLFTDDNKVIASSGNGGGSGDSDELGLNLTYIKRITENLSIIVNNPAVYPMGSIAKGRYFGSDGEHFAKNKLVGWMENLSLDTTIEQIQNIKSEFRWRIPSVNLTEDIDIQSYGIIINNEQTQTSNNLTDFYVRPSWNWRLFRGIIELWIEKEIVDNITEGIDRIASLFNFNFSEFPIYNWVFNESRLTKNVKFENLSLYQLPDYNIWYKNFIEDEYENITNNESIVDFATFMDYLLPAFQTYYDFTFGDLNESYASEKFYWFDDEWYDISRGDNCDFLYLGEDQSFNPNATNRSSFYRCLIEDILPELPLFWRLKDYILESKSIIEHLLWNLSFCGRYKGVLIYNFDNKTYNMQNGIFDPSHNIYINGTIGKPIYSYFEDYNVTFWINQQWSNNVESYNVIGELEGIDTSKTVIIDCLYDSWWNQGTGDSAIGMGIVLGIAKYFDDYKIKPKYNLKFIGFAGEEAGLRGAYHYESNHPHSDENVIMVIDMNQVGFHHDGPPLVLNLINNNDSLYSTYSAIANVTEYEKRIGDNTTTLNVTDVHILSDYTPFNENRSGKCNTICFLKDLGWIYHHRSGDNHEEGDSMKYYNETDIRLTTELVWNVTKYFCVNPDCWWDSINYTFFDSEDEGDFNDSIRVNITAKTILPHDRLMANVTLRRVNDSSVQNVSIKDFTLNSSGKNISLIVTLPENKKPGEYFMHLDLLNSTGIIDFTLNQSGNYENQSISSTSDVLWPYNYNLTVPDFTNVNVSPDTVGYGFNVSISADVSTDANCSINNVTINIIYPNNSLYIFDMNNSVNDTYTFVFNDSWYYGQYQFYIWADDEYGNESGTPIYNFYVDAEASISVCTIKDDYCGNEIVNLTDPPGNIFKVGYEFLDDCKVLHIWNRFDSYYFNTSNGVQFTNHKDDYWSTNVLMLGYYNNDVWNLIYRTDNLSGFNKNIISDNETFVNATLWKDLTYNGYDFRLAIRYYLGVDDNELTVIPYIKNIDDEDITYNLGFAWELKDIQVNMTSSGDYIEIDGTSYYLNQTLDETYMDLDNPCFYIKEDKTSDTFESLYLRWNINLNYKLNVESREGQYNAPVTLGIKIGTLNVGQEKYTNLYWHDASEIIFYFDDYAVAEAWASNPGFMVDGNVSNYASTSISEDSERCNNNSCDGSYLGFISKVEIRCKAFYTGSVNDLILIPIYGGSEQGDAYYYSPSNSSQWSQWFNLSGDDSSWPVWNWLKVKNLDCIVLANDSRDSFTLYCSEVEIRVTYTPNDVSCISNPFPEDGSIGISISPILSITVSDANNDNMTIIWFSNSSGTWEVFGTNSSVGNGTYSQVFSNASVNGQWWYWNVSVDDGEVVNSSDIFSFYTGCESKIYNSGDTNISGYLSLIIEFYNSTCEDWETEMGVIDKSFVVINGGEKLGLDTLFNPEIVNTSSFTHGNGTYRIYSMLQDPFGSFLFDGTLGFVEGVDDLKAWYEFTVTGL